MLRLTGLRPSLMQECFGWEWIAESWLHQEAKDGNLSRGLIKALFPEMAGDRAPTSALAAESAAAESGILRVAETQPSPPKGPSVSARSSRSIP
jgi:hypothetical protein